MDQLGEFDYRKPEVIHLNPSLIMARYQKAERLVIVDVTRYRTGRYLNLYHHLTLLTLSELVDKGLTMISDLFLKKRPIYGEDIFNLMVNEAKLEEKAPFVFNKAQFDPSKIEYLKPLIIKLEKNISWSELQELFKKVKAKTVEYYNGTSEEKETIIKAIDQHLSYIENQHITQTSP